MSHRINIYNTSVISEVSESDAMMVEWGYDVPLLLQSLFVGDANVAGNSYNNHTYPDDSGLYYDAKAGIENFKKVYKFLENHNSELIDDFEKFSESKKNLFNYLEKLRQPYFHIDAWDVFNMSDVPHEEQAQQLLKDIRQNNQVFTAAIEADDITLLDSKSFTRESILGFGSFKELLNYVDYDYGWEHIWKDYVEPQDYEIYEENGLWGLKNDKGDILSGAFYDNFYQFEEESNLAIVVKDEKFGFLNKSGKTVIPLIYDDAYDFKDGFAIVKKDGKEGLINLKAELKIPFIYDEIREFDDCYSAKLGEKYGIIDSEGNVKLALEFDSEFEEQSWKKIYSVKENGKGGRRIYTSEFAILGHFHTDYIDLHTIYDSKQNYYAVRKHKYQNTNILFASNGNVIIDDFERIIEIPNALVIRKDKKYGLFKNNAGFVLDFEYDKIEEVSHFLDLSPDEYFPEIPSEEIYNTTTFIKLTKNNLHGLLFSIGNFETLALNVNYEDLKPIKSEFFALKSNSKWSLTKITGKHITDFDYDEIIPVISHSGIAYGIINDYVYIINEAETVPANKNHLQDYIDANGEYGYYYFNNDIQKKLQKYIDSE